MTKIKTHTVIFTIFYFAQVIYDYRFSNWQRSFKKSWVIHFMIHFNQKFTKHLVFTNGWPVLRACFLPQNIFKIALKVIYELAPSHYFCNVWCLSILHATTCLFSSVWQSMTITPQPLWTTIFQKSPQLFSMGLWAMMNAFFCL